MKRILVTGSTGFVGRNIFSGLQERYEVSAPSRSELDIKQPDQVEDFLRKEYYDAVILSAIPTPFSKSDCLEKDILKSCIVSFMNFYIIRHLTGKIIYFGSGAEFDKNREISNVTEEELSTHVPTDEYGLAKYIMNELAEKSENVYNLRLFGCYGPTDGENKFIAHCIRCCLERRPITIRQNRNFDYLFVEDLVPILYHFIERSPRFHQYNVCSGSSFSLLDIAQIVKKMLDSDQPIIIQDSKMGKSYTASNVRIQQEIRNVSFTTLQAGIELQIKSTINIQKK